MVVRNHQACKKLMGFFFFFFYLLLSDLGANHFLGFFVSVAGEEGLEVDSRFLKCGQRSYWWLSWRSPRNSGCLWPGKLGVLGCFGANSASLCCSLWISGLNQTSGCAAVCWQNLCQHIHRLRSKRNQWTLRSEARRQFVTARAAVPVTETHLGDVLSDQCSKDTSMKSLFSGMSDLAFLWLTWGTWGWVKAQKQKQRCTFCPQGLFLSPFW